MEYISFFSYYSYACGKSECKHRWLLAKLTLEACLQRERSTTAKPYTLAFLRGQDPIFLCDIQSQNYFLGNMHLNPGVDEERLALGSQLFSRFQEFFCVG